MKVWFILIFWLAMSQNAAAHNIDMDVIEQIESGGDSQAVSPAGCIGLFQICAARDHYNEVHGTNYTKFDIFDPAVNRKIANWYFGWLEKHLETTVRVLAGYNWGYGNVRRWDGAMSSLPRETQNYIRKYIKITGGKL